MSWCNTSIAWYNSVRFIEFIFNVVPKGTQSYVVNRYRERLPEERLTCHVEEFIFHLLRTTTTRISIVVLNFV